MWTVSDLWDPACRGSHVLELRVDAYVNGVLTASDLPIDPESATLTVDGESSVRRSVELTISDPSLVPTARESLLSPYATELHIFRGFRYPDGSSETVPVGVFRVSRPSTPLYGAVQVYGVDRAKLIQDDIFTRTETPSEAATYAEEIERLIKWSLGQDTPVSISGDITTDAPLPTVTWEQGGSKLDAIDELALAIECEVYVDPEGVFQVRPLPRISQDPVWAVNVGDDGVIIGAVEEWDREAIFNAAIVRGEPSDGTTPVYWTASDMNPASPTYWNGPFGHRSRPPYVSPLITTTAQALRTAETLVWRGIAPLRTIRAEVVPNPALEPGDVVEVVLPDGRSEMHMVRGYTLPLGLGPMELDLYTPDPVVPS